ncbi:hypothetical protein ACOSP7_006804 [Xanthoceras sorbifolium]
MTEEILSMIIEADTAQHVWSSLEEQLLPMTREKEATLKDELFSLKKRSSSIDEYIRKFKTLCGSLAAINQPVSNIDKVFQLAQGLGSKYQDFCVAMLSKPSYPSLNQFVLSLQSHEDMLKSQREEEKQVTDHAQTFFGQRGRRRNGR